MTTTISAQDGTTYTLSADELDAAKARLAALAVDDATDAIGDVDVNDLRALLAYATAVEEAVDRSFALGLKVGRDLERHA